MKKLRYGDTEQSPDRLFRMFDCKAAHLTVLDNQKRPTARIKFTRLLPASLSSLQMTYDQSSELSFTINFTYEEISYELIDPMIGGVNPTAPETISPCGVTEVVLPPVAEWN